MLDLTPFIVAKNEETFQLNWKYRKKYLLEQVIARDQMQMVEHHPPYWLIHYLSEEYGASQARLSEQEWQDIQDHEPEAVHQLQQVPFCEVGPGPHEPDGPSIQHELAQVVEQPLLPNEQIGLDVMREPEVVFVPSATGPPYTQEQLDAAPVEVKEVLAEHGFVDKVVLSVPITVGEENLAFLDQVSKLSGGDIEVKVQAPAHTGQRTLKERTLEEEAARQQRIAAKKEEAKQKRKLAKNPPLPKLPEKKQWPALIMPTVNQLFMGGIMHNTLEWKVVTNSIDQLRDWYIAENDSDRDGYYTLWDSILHRGYTTLRYWQIATVLRWANISMEVATNVPVGKEQPFDVIFATATAFFAGRMLAVVQTYQEHSDEPHGDRIEQMLVASKRLDTNMTVHELLTYVAQQRSTIDPLILDRVDLVERLFEQVQRIGKLPLSNQRDTFVDSSSITIKRLSTVCRELQWNLNITRPEGYAFFQGLLHPKRLFFTKQERLLLSHLLSLTNKTIRP